MTLCAITFFPSDGRNTKRSCVGQRRPECQRPSRAAERTPGPGRSFERGPGCSRGDRNLLEGSSDLPFSAVGSGPRSECRRQVCVTNNKQERIQLTPSRSGASLTVATVGRACLREVVRYVRTVDRSMQCVCLAMGESLTRTQDRGQARAE